jgi:hypothetical protein
MKLTSYLPILLIITIAGCFSVFAQQENRWTFISKSSDGTLFYIDKNSRQGSGDNIRVWNKSIFWNGSFRLDLVEWNCREEKYLFVEASFYSQTGKFLRIEKGTEWMNIIPDSISEALHKAVCGESLKKDLKTKSPNRKIAQIIVRKANLRAEPNLNSSVIQRANLSEQFFLADEQPRNGWYQIIITGTNKTAWIYGNNFKIVEAANKTNTKKQRTKRQS